MERLCYGRRPGAASPRRDLDEDVRSYFRFVGASLMFLFFDSYCLGTTPHGSDFQLFHPEFEAQVKVPFGQFLERAYRKCSFRCYVLY